VQLQEVGIMNELKSLEEISGELDRQNDRLKRKRDHLEVNVEEENRRILSQLLGNIAGQNTEVQEAKRACQPFSSSTAYSFHRIATISHACKNQNRIISKLNSLYTRIYILIS
jgi:hypothetical protein